MADIMKSEEEKKYWSQRYQEKRTGWDIGSPSIPLQSYFEQLEDKNLKILIPGAGNAYEAEYLFKKGYEQVHVLDIALEPLVKLQQRIPNFPESHIIQANFFEHSGAYDLIIEQTFFCSFPPLPATRQLYAEKMHELLKNNGKLVGLWFNMPLTGDMVKRPFGGTMEEYLGYLAPYFEMKIFEDCYNSIPSRQGQELFGIFSKKINQ